MSLTTLLGDTLLASDGTTSLPTSSLDDSEVVGLYFSAHWCGPCRGFTPQLATQYTALKDAGKSFEIVFLSSDRTDDAFAEYFADMPWLAVPYAARDIKEALSKKYKVRGIPTLVLINGKTGELITTNGRSKVMDAASWPWTPKTLAEMLGTSFVRANGEQATLTSRVLGIYFSAHWCPPCRGFTPVLAEKYKALKAAGKDLEIVFASSDRDQSSFDEYLSEMPWLALPYNLRKEKEALSEHFDVSGIPSLIFIDRETGKTINTEGRAAISQDSFIEDFPFHPKPVNDVASGPGAINETPSIVLLMESADADAQAAAEAALLEVAEPELLKVEAKQRCGAFFTAKESGGIAARIRQMCKLPDSSTSITMVLLDIPDNGGYYVAKSDSSPTVATIESFIADFKASKLDRQQLS